jgi:hypothetical protein
MEGSACFSACRRYRYSLWRRWGPGPAVMVVGLNPSTADAIHNDPTIRRCLGFARAWGYGALCMTNLFAYRALDPARLKRVKDPIGAENDHSLQQLARGAALILAAWGNHGGLHGRDLVVRGLLPELHILGLTRMGQPRHPLYLPRGLQPQLWPQPLRPVSTSTGLSGARRVPSARGAPRQA